jgi:hypothetical protein
VRRIYHPAAEPEVLEASLFYARRSDGLGERFLEEFDRAINAIEAAPLRWRSVEGEVRRYMMRRFPYGIYYRCEGDELRILVVKHHKRNPDYGKDRLGS